MKAGYSCGQLHPRGLRGTTGRRFMEPVEVEMVQQDWEGGTVQRWVESGQAPAGSCPRLMGSLGSSGYTSQSADQHRSDR